MDAGPRAQPERRRQSESAKDDQFDLSVAPLDAKDLTEVRDFVATAVCAQLQSFSPEIDADCVATEPWRLLMLQLPTSCTRFEIRAQRWSDQELSRLLDSLPAHVRQLECSRRVAGQAACLVDDRFDELDVRALDVDLELAESLSRRLEACPRLKIRLGPVASKEVLLALGERAVVGGEGDALLVHEVNGRVMLLRRWSVEQLQRRSGFIQARAQLTRSVVEAFGVRSADRVIHADELGENLVRRVNGSWAARVRGEQFKLSIDGRRVGAKPTPFADGALIEIDGEPFRFSLVD